MGGGGGVALTQPRNRLAPIPLRDLAEPNLPGFCPDAMHGPDPGHCPNRAALDTGIAQAELVTGAGAAWRGGALGDGSATLGPRPARAPAALDRDEPHQSDDAQDQRDPEVQPLAQDVMGRIDSQRLLEDPEARVPGDVEGEQARRLDL